MNDKKETVYYNREHGQKITRSGESLKVETPVLSADIDGEGNRNLSLPYLRTVKFKDENELEEYEERQDGDKKTYTFRFKGGGNGSYAFSFDGILLGMNLNDVDSLLSDDGTELTCSRTATPGNPTFSYQPSR